MTYHPIPGPNHVSEYQASGIPFASSSVGTGVVRFPYVTQWIFIRPITNVTAAFTQEGLNSTNRFVIPSGSTYPMFTWKLKELWMSGTADIVAGLTFVSREKMWDYVHPPASGAVGAVSGSFTTFGYDGV